MNKDVWSDDMPKKLLAWLPVVAGLLLICIPTFVGLFNGIWKTDRNAHGPIVLAVSLWFLGFRIKQLLEARQISYDPEPVAGWCLLGMGLSVYVLGRSQGVYFLEVGALLPIIAACVVMFFGLRSLAKLWFSFFFMLFFIPLPATMVDAMTQPLKIGVSVATEHILYWFGYPIARNGVILNIGQYQLLVADACAGLNSLFTLEALGLLYMNLVGHKSVARNALLATLIVPISFTSNVVRVITLSLITYYMGDAAGQGFLHGFSGMMLFLTALLLIIGVDTLLGALLDKKNPATAAKPTNSHVGEAADMAAADPAGDKATALPSYRRLDFYAALGIKLKPAVSVGIAMLLAVISARALTPELSFETGVPDFAKLMPSAFGDWKEIESPYAQIDLATNDGQLTDEQPYDAVFMRTYANSAGEQVMLALAYAREQRQEVKIHRPEVCYESQGFTVVSAVPAEIKLGTGDYGIPGMHMVARNRQRTEAVSYWIRIGDKFSRSSSQARWYIFRDGMKGKVPDGILVRASTVQRSGTGTDRAYETHEAFLGDLVKSLSPDAAHLLKSQS